MPSTPQRRTLIAMLAAIAGGVAWLAYRNSPEFEQTWIELDVDSDSRRAIVCRPVTTDSKTSLPLILVFHGMGDTAESVLRDSRFSDFATDGKAIVVAPETVRNVWLITSDWGDLPDNPDVKLIDRLLTRLSSEVKYDSSRVYAVGISNGATFVETLAVAMPDRFAAIAAYAGGLPELETPPPKPTTICPLLLLAGDQDETGAEASVRSTAEILTKAGYEVQLKILPGQSHQWNPANNELLWPFFQVRRNSDTK